MKKIPLTQGYIALVDDDRYELINQYNYYAIKKVNTIYARRSIRLAPNQWTKVYIHHDILGNVNGYEVDHIDGDGLNNQRANLRFVTRRQNKQNLLKINKSSQYPGVYLHKPSKLWRAVIRIKGKTQYLGGFKKEIDAAQAYIDAVHNIGETMVGEIRNVNQGHLHWMK